MGKIKRERQKFHITAENKDETKVQQNKTSTCQTLPPRLLDNVQNIFAGVNIQLDAMNKFDDTPPKTTKEPLQSEKETIKTNIPQSVKIDTEKHLTKKEKMILKHEKLMQKLDVTQKARLQGKRMKKTMPSLVSTPELRSMTTAAAVKTSNLRTNNDDQRVSKSVLAIPSFNDDLPALDSVAELKKLSSHKTASKSKSISKNNKGKKSFVNNYNFLRKVMANKKK